MRCDYDLILSFWPICLGLHVMNLSAWMSWPWCCTSGEPVYSYSDMVSFPIVPNFQMSSSHVVPFIKFSFTSLNGLWVQRELQLKQAPGNVSSSLDTTSTYTYYTY